MSIALFGNPNTGKSTVFNLLTGLRQKVGNFPGVTVEKRTGTFTLDGEELTLLDVPGSYSIYPNTKEEEIVQQIIFDKEKDQNLSLGIVVVDGTNLERNLLLFTQLSDLQIPLILVINMMDLAARQGVEINLENLQKKIPNTPVIFMNARVALGKERLLAAIRTQRQNKSINDRFVSEFNAHDIQDKTSQGNETKIRLQIIKNLLEGVVYTSKVSLPKNRNWERWLIHPIAGYGIFAFILLVIFQLVFWLAAYPMDWIENGFIFMAHNISIHLPSGVFNDLLCQGIIPGISGVLVFIPQIAILFMMLSLLEETGYLARAVFLMDRIVRPFGLNGRSVVPLLSSLACAIPGVLATRGISNKKERLITIFVAPLMSCSARIPVFTLLISLVIPAKRILGIIQLQGLVLFSMYLLGIISAIAVAWLLKLLLKDDSKSFFLMEIPSLKPPVFRNIYLTAWEKVRVFVLEAGGIIVAISILLWILASHGPASIKEQAQQDLKQSSLYIKAHPNEREQLENAVELENSYIGIMGKTIAPAIEPLGYDWKIGIALITSFAAREVFVGSLSTIYATQTDTDEPKRLLERLKSETKADGSPQFTLRTGASLMVFYVYAMQCLSTLAVVKKETQSWFWPIIQILFFGFLAFVMAYLTYNIL